MAAGASYSHWILSTGWRTVIDVVIVCSPPFHHFYFYDISILCCLINVVIIIKVVSPPLSHASMLPCFLGCGVQTHHNWRWCSPASLLSSSCRLRRYDQPSHPHHNPLSLAPIFDCTQFPMIMLSAGGISTCAERTGENDLDEASTSHPRLVVENSMKGEAEKMSKRWIGHPPTRKIKRVWWMPRAVQSGCGGGGESAILPAQRCQNLAAEIGILNFGLWKKIHEGLCAAVKC